MDHVADTAAAANGDHGEEEESEDGGEDFGTKEGPGDKQRITPEPKAGHRQLSDYEKEKLGPYIPEIDLKNVVLHIGETPRFHDLPFPFPKDAEGITIGNDIYLRKRAYDRTFETLALIAHELFHVGQYRTGTMTVGSYLNEMRKNGSGRENKYEGPAYDFGEKVLDHLKSNTNFDGSPRP